MCDDMETETRPAESTGRTLLPVILAGIWRHRVWVVVAMAVGGAIGAFQAVVTPSMYRSSGKLFVRPGAREIVQPDIAFSAAGNNASRLSGTREAIMNEMQVLLSPELCELAVEQLGVNEVLAPFDPGAAGKGSWYSGLMHSFQSWWFSVDTTATEPGEQGLKIASAILARNLVIVPEAGTSVITLYYFSSSPERAKRIIDAVLAAAQSRHRMLFEEMSGVTIVEEEYRTNELLAREAEKALRDFRQEKGVQDYQDQHKALLAYVDSLDRQLDTIRLDIGRRTAEKTALSGLLANIPPERIASGSETYVVNPDYEMLIATLSRLQADELALENMRGTITPDELEKRRATMAARIDVVSARLATEKVQLKLDGFTEKNPEYARIEQRLADIEVELKGLESQRSQVETLRKAQRKALEDLDALAPLFRTLDLDARQKRASADRLAEGVTNLKAVQRLEQLNLSSLQVMQAGTLEPEKVAPKRTKLVTIGSFLGAAVGLGLVGLWSLFDSKVRIAADLKRLGIPSHATLPSTVDAVTATADPRVPAAFAELRTDIARFWSALPYERGAEDGLKIACMACGDAEVGRAAAALALGLALHGGERVAYVASALTPSWLKARLGLSSRRGWSEVVAGKAAAAEVAVPTGIVGLDHFEYGEQRAGTLPVPGPAFLAFLDELSRRYRFVVVELPNLDVDPAGRSVLGAVDGVELVVRSGLCAKSDFRATMLSVNSSGCRLLGCILQPPEPKPAKGEAIAAAV
jgi:uncharacterized protein involved in exopolysaccharide biosynthesis/Mrp family chromosome partitioning ATPase